MPDKKLVVITGSSGLLGTVICKLYGKYYNIVGVSRSKNAVNFYDSIQADINECPKKIVKLIIKRHGKIDVLINNAAATPYHSVQETTRDIFSDTLKTNVVIPHLLAKLAFEEFWSHHADDNKAHSRNIINISSVSAMNCFEGQAAYASSKAALNSLTYFQAQEYEPHGLRANAIAPTSFPGIIKTERVAKAIFDIERSKTNGKVKVIDV